MPDVEGMEEVLVELKISEFARGERKEKVDKHCAASKFIWLPCSDGVVLESEVGDGYWRLKVEQGESRLKQAQAHASATVSRVWSGLVTTWKGCKGCR